MAGRAEQELERIIALTEGRRYQPPQPNHLGLQAAGRLCVALSAGLLFVLAALVAFGAAVDNGWYRIIALEGASMEPTIRAGDALLITSAPARLESGMIVLLEVDGHLVVHRVVATRLDGGFVTKGDANLAIDTWEEGGSRVTVEGLYRGRIPFLGQLLRFASLNGAG